MQASTTDSPEARLILAILKQAWLDMLTGASSHQHEDNGHTRYTAIRFFTDLHGKHARWRNELCDLCNMDGNHVAQQTRRMLNGEIDIPYVAEEANDAAARTRALKRHAGRVENLRAFWKDLKNTNASL